MTALTAYLTGYGYYGMARTRDRVLSPDASPYLTMAQTTEIEDSLDLSSQTEMTDIQGSGMVAMTSLASRRFVMCWAFRYVH
ncbi:hypothetical protein TSTA_021550 [Talaromyces stipitatus ATCC 10500]|uniref:Uncharacterized protein n=1 Tax=Talaromyces stipitatus (strain ATCC 10500 / CBS 375.48 / QM 6759 / NRRL 1006) TaxID=441959 RepID=B8MHB9_TALSN|nr:uncharacterized protein TSTA_021550 [Talaromyces stipitatus ATCC 10500]EED17098.1 hypothetical protein TSTA_021550 [Talaromyces stipitatus ATCC 10500]